MKKEIPDNEMFVKCRLHYLHDFDYYPCLNCRYNDNIFLQIWYRLQRFIYEHKKEYRTKQQNKEMYLAKVSSLARFKDRDKILKEALEKFERKYQL